MAIFGNAMVGHDAGADPIPRADAQRLQVETSVPAGPGRYRGLRTGPDFTVEYDPQTAAPIDASNRMLRNLSPFVLRVEPPMIYASEPALTTPSPEVNTGIYQAAGSSRAFTSARQNAASTFAQGSRGASTADEYIARSQMQQVKTSRGEAGAVPPDRIGSPALADIKTAVDIVLQLREILAAPPLVLLINPQSLSMSFTKVQQFQDRTRYGYIFHAWGEEQPKMTVSARCGAFVSAGRGVQWASRRDSAAYQNLAAAFRFYRHNGYIYDTLGRSNAHLAVGTISIHYDQWIYYGNMGSFSYSYDEGNQLGGVTFEMEFTVSAAVDTAMSSSVVLPMRAPTPSFNDPRYRGAQNAGFNRPGTVYVGEGGVHGQTGGSTVFGIPQATPSNQSSLFSPPSTPAGNYNFNVTGGSGFQPAPSSASPITGALASPEPFGFGG